MISRAALFAVSILAAVPGIADAQSSQTLPPKSFWKSGFGHGITEYSTGTFDQPVDGGIRIACLPDGGATLSVQIRGAAPAAGSRFLLIPAARTGRSQSFAFSAGADGTVKFRRAATDRQLGRLWTALRGGSNVTIRFADGGFNVQSLVGARTTLPSRACR